MPYFLIDNHIHGSFGINFNEANYEQIKFVLAELYKKNIKGICPTLVGDKDEKIYEQLKLLKQIRDEQLININSEALILGVHLEGTFLSPQKSGIQDSSVFKKPTVENFKNLVKDMENIVKIVTIAPENDVDLIDYLNGKNIKTQAGHTVGENLKKCVGVTHLFNAMNQIHHRNSTIALSSLLNDEIYVEVIPDLIHLSIDALKLILKTKPKNKILLISDSLPSSNFDKEITFCNKKINSDGKDENGVLAGSNMTLDEIVKNLIKKEILTEKDIIQMGFKNQINYLNLSKKEINILKSIKNVID